MATFYASRRRSVTQGRLASYVGVGFFVGLLLGWVFMGTVHAILEKGVANDSSLPVTSAARQASGRRQQMERTVQQEQQKQEEELQEKQVQSGQQQNGQQHSADDAIHTICPSNGSPYQNYQMRIAYATYKLILGMPGGERHVGFTRVLHRTVPDELMEEIPTFRAAPLQPECDGWCEYPVSDRANAVKQFLEAARADPSLIKAPWLYVIESDYVFMKPLQLPAPVPAGASVDGWAFHFDYIQPTWHKEAMLKLYPQSAGSVTDIPRTGPAPALMRREVWERLVPEWERLTAVIEADKGMREELGWVREMYAFSSAVALLKLRLELSKAPQGPFISELPVFESLGSAHAFHYTLCTIYQTVDGGKDVWKFDKRFFTRPEDVARLQPIPTPPPFQEGKWKFIEGRPVGREVHAAIEQMVAQMNRGIAMLKPLSS